MWGADMITSHTQRSHVNPISILRLAVLCACVFVGHEAVAQETLDEISNPWVLGVSTQFDDTNSQSLLATFDWGVNSSNWLGFAWGESRSPGTRADLEAEALSARLDHRFGVVGFTVEAERWGDSSALESSDYSGSVYFRTERFRLALEQERRDIEIHFTLPGLADRPLRRTANADADGTSLSLQYWPTERLQLYALARRYDYSRNLAVVPRIDALNLLSTSALTLANSLVDEESLFGFQLVLGQRLLDVGYGHDRSAVDRSELESINFSFLLPVSRRADLQIDVGRSNSDVFGAGLYGGLLFMFHGG